MTTSGDYAEPGRHWYDEAQRLQRQNGRLLYLAHEAAQVIDNLRENGPDQGYGYYNEAGRWQDGERILDELRDTDPLERCGAGHACCDDPNPPPIHDHFLDAAQCPKCSGASA